MGHEIKSAPYDQVTTSFIASQNYGPDDII